MNRALQGIRHHFLQAGLLDYLEDPDLTEIMLNPDGKLWIERQGEAMTHVGEVTSEDATRILNAVSDYHRQTVTATQPILECELPLDGSRFEGLIPPLVENPSFVIRKKATRVFTFDDYIKAGTLSREAANVLRQLIVDKRNILVAGGTGSGKTTFGNALLHQISMMAPDERMVIIEDTNELQCSAPNHVIKRTNDTANVSMRTLLRTTLRYRPDRIMVGEVRGGEALDLLKAWNTGHPGGIATIHADSARQGLDRLEQCVSEATATPNRALIASGIHAVVFMARTSEGKRVIKEVIQVNGLSDTGYDTATIWEAS
ncbi:TPA: P-type conjugative transfer ATPase TrbB [Vibrio parahaemolyticus]|uniref:P-type conjugative transfer ATPase TrbB n=2 Tax=Vibrio parahaemolyticus TaxID=670 RepID=UPI00111D706C|nr:P-type conjugative transfer ATPase TrbB [Vibrio parahaemolyticus]EKQ3596341.1 P-type conjugative transfer ATPase TrbB [Vibrio parahaemolyticus]TOI48168.1 P-type conjugative transfer ATPase TrbB [Vibrio parahaemolyticus]TOO77449.1 P-type conjugative transfer ATPase TrbB [Vibrio parahaemolyticus]HCH1122242.1 P-type conjugative transfer ATPase TrbB [Vibrio parahaemolyticus]HCH4062894.1 P-type conjugative transfer ATPase TrbB [Vibrio parahaemolyticus]